MSFFRADVAVLIVSYNTADLLEGCLRSLLDERGAMRQQVIVVDNGSADGSAEMVRNRFPSVDLVAAGANLGFARGVNLAASRANAEFLLLLNPATGAPAGPAPRLVGFARMNPDHGLYGGRTVRRDGSLEPSSCWALPSLWSVACFALGLTTLFRGRRLFDPESIPGWNRDTVQTVGIVTGCLLLVRQELWRRMGGLDERYFMYGEDADLAFRMKKAGYSVVIFPDACIVHDVGKASATRADKLLLLHRGKATLFRDHFHGWRQRFVLGGLVAGVGLRAMLSRAAAAAFGSKADGWTTLWANRRSWIGGYGETGGARTAAEGPEVAAIPNAWVPQRERLSHRD
jgi:N-acetylglucosaminyl-diphospho-decaprenol L-rhamnosyltransferase